MGGFKSIKLTVKPIGVKWNYLNLLIFNYEQRAPSSIKNAEIKKAPAELRCKTGGYGQFPCFRTTGKPCSCHLCSPYRYAKGIKKEEYGAKRFEIAQSGI